MSGRITPVKELECLLNRMLGGLRAVLDLLEKRKSLVPARDSTPDLLASSLDNILTTLRRLPYVMAAQRHRV